MRDDIPTTTQAWSAGIVQVYYSGVWGNICDNHSYLDYSSTGVGYDEADVICHQLGYTGSSSHSNTQETTM